MSDPRNLDDRLRALEEELNRTLAVPGVDRVGIRDLFPEAFMRENTRFDSIEAFVRDASMDPAGDEPLTPVIDDFVRGTTEFGSWSEMRQKAEIAWMRRASSGKSSAGS